MGRALAVYASALVVIGAACGARTGLPVGESMVDAAVDASEADGPSCKGTSVPVVPSVPDLYFVLDTSGSMAGDKWTNVRTVVASLILELGADARFGTTVFPGPGTDLCATGIEVMPITPGDALGRTEAAFLQATALTPHGGTPTAATFRALASRFTAASMRSPIATYVILATDGGPNCNAEPSHASCNVDQCTRNIDGIAGCPQTGPTCCAPGGDPNGCLDGPATAAAVSDLLALGIKTFVLGIPGSSPYGAVLDQIASAGGTARASEPLYYRVDTADTSALGSALGEIAAQALKSCVVTLERTPADPNQVNVYLGDAVVHQDGPDGWSLMDRTVMLEGASCAAVQADAGNASVRVIEGCPTVK